MHLSDRRPDLDASALAKRFVPPHRFEDVSFDSYIPDADFPSQQQASRSMQSFARSTHVTPKQKRWPWSRESTVSGKPARYLDGGFGTGKTHLLAATWHASNAPKAFVTFTELTAFVGFAGMRQAVETFAEHRLICIDEFELDDVANTLMVVSFLRGVMHGGLRLAVTSNTLPDRLGEQRFSAADFRREIAAIASYFDELRVDGPDYRTHHAPLPLATHVRSEDDTCATEAFDDLLEHLRQVHPVQYGALFDDLDGVTINDMHTIDDQDAALLFVQFVDKLYDARIPVHISGCDPSEVFHHSYRHGSYRKKYGRAESRLTAMHAETAASD